MNEKHTTDQEILLLFRDPLKREEGFNKLVLLYQQRLYWHIRRMLTDHDDTDDVLQEVFIKVWNNLDRFRADSQLYTWLYRIATNECISFLKRKKMRATDSLETLSTHPVGESSPDGNKIQIKLQQALMSLPAKQRAVFNMKYFDDLTYEAISVITGTSVGALKASYHLAVKKIEKYFEEH